MEYKIRDIRPGESKSLKELAKPNFSVVEQLFIPKPKLGFVAETSEGQIAGGTFLVVIETGEQKVGCIDIIFVLPEHRGTGVAKLLYHAAVQALRDRGCNTVMALVRGDNSQSFCRFQSEGLHPVSLRYLRQRIGLKATALLYRKTASLAFATGCWILCEGAEPECIGGVKENLLRVFLANALMLLGGAVLGVLLHISDAPWWNLLAALFLLGVITLGETLGRLLAGGTWRFVMPEGGLVPSAVVALLGGFYPMLGHWYVFERENTAKYRRRMAMPVKCAWLLLLAVTVICRIVNQTHPFFSGVMDLGMMLLLFYILPFYPFDTFGGRRIREQDGRAYGAFVTLSIIGLAYMVCGISL